MTLDEEFLSIKVDDPLAENAYPEELCQRLAERLERVRQQSVALYSSSPLYQARAAKDPDYWNKFYIRAVR
jgi:hypothetical protein